MTYINRIILFFTGIFSISVFFLYKRFITSNEELLVAIATLLFLFFAYTFIIDVIKSVIFNRMLLIKQKYMMLLPVAEKTLEEFEKVSLLLAHPSTYDPNHNDYYHIFNSFVSEIKDCFNNGLVRNNEKSQMLLSRMDHDLDIVGIYEIYHNINVELALVLYMTVIYTYVLPTIFLSFIHNSATSKNNHVYTQMIQQMIFYESRYSSAIYKAILKELMKK